jgi:hypothetical protein
MSPSCYSYLNSLMLASPFDLVQRIDHDQLRYQLSQIDWTIAYSWCITTDDFANQFTQLLCAAVDSCTTRIHYKGTRSSHCNNFFVNSVSSNVRRNFISHSGVVIWNNLDTSLKMNASLYNFKKSVKKLLFNSYV